MALAAKSANSCAMATRTPENGEPVWAQARKRLLLVVLVVIVVVVVVVVAVVIIVVPLTNSTAQRKPPQTATSITTSKVAPKPVAAKSRVKSF